jgi:peptide-methionine (R)-S-oxide reductase
VTPRAGAATPAHPDPGAARKVFTVMRTITSTSLVAATLLFSCCGPEGAAQADPKPLASAPAAEAKAPADEIAPAVPPGAASSGAAQKMTYNKLNDQETYVLLNKGTERAGTGEYTDLKDEGLYICRQCNAPLYRSADKFHSGCGWPSFDDEIADAIERHEDVSFGMVRTEIVCKNCKGHLGHVFFGERMTEKNTRHCVNSVSMRFVPAGGDAPPKIVLEGGPESGGD